MAEQSPTGSTEQRRRRRWPQLVAVALVAAFTGGMATRAMSQGPGWGHHWHGGFRGPMSASQIEDRIDRAVRHASIEIDATAEQQEKLRTIAKATVKDLLPLRDQARAARERATALLTQPKVDRAAIEALRAEQMALAETASKRFTQALGDVAEVLTPEQRSKVHDFIQHRKSYWRGWNRG